MKGTRRTILLTGAAGIAGALGMFAGDMLLYFTTAEYDPSGGLLEYARIMSGVSPARLIAGSMLGPICAFLYCVGFGQLLLAVKKESQWTARITVTAFWLAWIVGGAYHSQFGALGGAAGSGGAEAVVGHVEVFYRVTIGLFAVAAALLAFSILTGRTWYPRRFVLLTPAVLIWLPLNLLPQPFRIVLMGGWTNLMFLPFFFVSTWSLIRKAEKLKITKGEHYEK